MDEYVLTNLSQCRSSDPVEWGTTPSDRLAAAVARLASTSHASESSASTTIGTLTSPHCRGVVAPR
jgi:hypothetical protein